MLFDGETYTIQFWQDEILGRVLAIDTETSIKPFTETPDLITFQVYDGESLFYVPRDKVFTFLDLHKDRILVFANASFDIDVIEKDTDFRFKEQIEGELIYDILIMYRLLKLGTVGSVPNRYGLSLITEEFLGISLDKNVEIRCNFESYRDIPVEEIPIHFLEYGAADVIATHKTYACLQRDILKTGTTTCLSHHIQLLGSLALNRMYKNGIGYDESKATIALESLRTKMKDHFDIMCTYGWVKGMKGNQGVYNNIIEYLEIPLPKTDKGDYSMKESELEPYKVDPFINSYLNYKKLEKTTFFIRKLSGDRVHPRYDLLKNTGRTGCSSPNIQQLPRDGDIRSMFRAAEGNVLLITDYSAIELSTLAQVLYDSFGESVMRDKINEGADLHRYYASVLFSTEEDKVEKWQRQAAKAANFGFPGGLGIDTFIEFSKGYGLDIPREEAHDMKKIWFEAFPEMKKYLASDIGYVWTRTGRLRADTTYCAEKNTPFQGLAADGAKIALYNLMKEGFKLVGFVHDEIITEVPKDKVEEMRVLQEQIMVQSMQVVVPDVAIRVESTISERYCK
mgnify:CR=1 FL=1